MNDSVYGTRRQGKSTLALALATERNPRTVIFDPNGQYTVIQAISIEALQKWLVTSEKQIKDYPKSFAVIRVGPFDTEDVVPAFEQFSFILFGQPDLSVIVDEAHMLQGTNYIDPNLDRWNRRSPASVLVVSTTHRLVDAHPDTRYHADNVFFFFADDELEVRTISKKYGPEVAEAVAKLELHQVIHFWRETGGYRRWSIWTDPADWFIDLENGNKVVANAH